MHTGEVEFRFEELPLLCERGALAGDMGRKAVLVDGVASVSFSSRRKRPSGRAARSSIPERGWPRSAGGLPDVCARGHHGGDLGREWIRPRR